jgi:hypothetical protein
MNKYLKFIERCKKKNYDNLKTHNHHIIPVSQGGLNESANLIKLSLYDHFWAHVYYAEVYKDCQTTPNLILHAWTAKEDWSEAEWEKAAQKAFDLNSKAHKGKP